MDTALTAKLLEFANTIRKTLGHPTIKEVVAGFKGDAKSCVIANTANCGLEVDYLVKGGEDAFFRLRDESDARKLAHAIGSEAREDPENEGVFKVEILDPELAELPARFDAGEFPEWDADEYLDEEDD